MNHLEKRKMRFQKRQGKRPTTGITCPECGKRCFETRREAKLEAPRITNVKLRVYKCGKYWHHTSADADTSAKYRSWNS